MSVNQTPTANHVPFNTSDSSRITDPSQLHKSPWPMRRHTPYSKTPQSRKIRANFNKLPRTPPTEAQVQDWKQLIKKTWHTYRATPLYNFSYDSKQLKRYSRLLSAHLKAERNKGIGVGSDEPLAEQALFSILEGLAVSANDSDAVDISLITKNGGSKQTTILNAVLVCVEAEVDNQLENFARLPLLLVKGPVGLTRIVLDFLRSEFDCIIKPLKFCPLDLAWMITVWAGFLEDGTKKIIDLLYKVPDEIKGLQRISLIIEADDAKALWDSIHEEGSNEVTGEEVASFIKSLECHFYRHFKVHLDAMIITRIGTPVANVGQEGKLKINSEDQVIHVLAYLTDIAISNIFEG